MLDISIDQIDPTVLFAGSWQNTRCRKDSDQKYTYTYRMLYTKLGSCRLEMADGNTYLMKSGDVFFFVPGTKYTSTFVPFQKTYFIDIAFDMLPNDSKLLQDTLLNKELRFSGDPRAAIQPYRFSDSNLFNKSRQLTPSLQTGRIFDRITREHKKNHPLAKKISSLHLHTILLSLICEEEIDEHIKSTNASERILKYIRDHITESITNERVALELSYHPNYINRAIKQATGMTFHKYVINQKLQIAVDLLLNTQNSITDIAHSLSFSTSSHFNNLFTSTFHCTPSQYRKRGR